MDHYTTVGMIIRPPWHSKKLTRQAFDNSEVSSARAPSRNQATARCSCPLAASRAPAK